MRRLQVITIQKLYPPGSDGLVVLPERNASLDPLPCQNPRNPMNIILPHLFKGNIAYRKPHGPHLCTFHRPALPRCDQEYMRHSVPSRIGRKQKRQASYRLEVLLRDHESNLFPHFSDCRAFDCLPFFNFPTKAVILACTKPGFLETQKNLSGRVSSHQQTQSYI